MASSELESSSHAGRSPRLDCAGRASRVRRAARLAFLLCALGAATAHADPTPADKETARTLMNEGDKRYASKDFAGALKDYQGAHAIMNVPTTGREVAKAQAALGLLIEARDTCLGVSRMPAVGNAKKEPAAFTKARAECEDLAQSLSPRIPTLRVVVVGPADGTELAVTVDGAKLPAAAATLPRKVNPGKHVVTASASGWLEARAEATLAEGGSAEVSVTLERAPVAAAPSVAAAPVRPPEATAPPPAAPTKPEPPATKAEAPRSGTSPLVYVGFGLAGAGVVVGGVTGLLALSKASKAKDVCDGSRCPPSAQDDIDGSKSMGTISTIAFGVGILGAGVGVYGLLSGKSEPSARVGSVRLTPGVGPGWASVGGSFLCGIRLSGIGWQEGRCSWCRSARSPRATR